VFSCTEAVIVHFQECPACFFLLQCDWHHIVHGIVIECISSGELNSIHTSACLFDLGLSSSQQSNTQIQA
jgi:hypothetical protein